jgi:4-hydroxybenzoate polyprenyltransferase
VTAGTVTVAEALALGAGLALAAFVLVLTTNPPTVLLSALGLAVTIGYPFAKRMVSMPQAVLGVAFSFGIPMAFAAAQGGTVWSIQVPWPGWALMASNLFWVLAYDTEYAMVDRDDDLRIGMKTSAITLGRFDVAAVMAFYALHLVSWALIGRVLGMGLWFFAGVVVAAAQALWHHTLIRERSRDGCFKAFRLNHWIGFALFAGAALDLALR